MDISKDARGEVSANHASETAAGADTAAIAAAARAQANDVPAGDGRHHGRGHARGHGHVHLTQTEAAAAAAGVHVTRVHASANGTVALPADVDLRDITVDGKDLVVHLPDGSLIVIVDGAAHTPHIQIGEVVVPPDTIAALIQIAQTEPAAGPPPSSGGNFEVPAGDIGPGLGLSPLLPPTELSFGTPQFQQVQGFLDLKPTVVIVTPDQPVGVIDADSPVHEAGLPARGSEPPGSDQASNSEFTTGTIVYTAGDGATTVSINGMLVTSVGQSFADTFGTLTITSIAPGAIGFSFQLEDNTLGQAQFTYPVHVADSNGSTADATLTIHVVDDVPTARADTDATVNGTADGNVMTGVGTTSGSAGADTQGADGASVTKVASNNVPANVDSTLDANHNLFVHGQYGDLTLNADGSYTYVRNAGTPGGVTDTFNYTLTDGDGSTSSATLTISIPDLAPVARPDTDSIPTNSLGPATGNVIAGSGETNSPAGADTLGDGANAITQVSSDNVPANVDTTTDASGNFVIHGQYGVLTLNANGDYSYARDAGSPGGVTDTFHYTLTDVDGDSSSTTLTINIAPDFIPPPPPPQNHPPAAVGDTNWAQEDSEGSTSGNVLQTLAHPGAPSGTFSDHADTDPDGNALTVTAVSGGTIGGSTVGAHGTLTLNADGTYSYVLNNSDPAVQALGVGQTTTDGFTYTISDGHGGTSSASLTITIFGTNDAPTAFADTNWTQEDTSVTATGNVLQTIDHTSGAPSGTFGDQADTDIDNGTVLSVSAVDNGSTGTVGGNTVGAHGTLVLNSDGSYTYTLDNADGAIQALGVGQTVTDTFNYTASDGQGGTSSATLTITIFGTNDAPTAVADTNWASEVTTASGNVLDTLAHPGAPSGTFSDQADTDPDNGDTLGVSAVSGTGAGTVGGSTAGAHGTLVLNADGTYTYTVDTNDAAVKALGVNDTLTDTFNYTASDGHGGTSSATLTVTIFGSNDPPVAANDTNWTKEDTNVTATGNVLQTIDHTSGAPSGAFGDQADTDPNSDPLTVTAVAGGTVGGNTVGAHGTLVLNSDGTYTYNLNNADSAVQGLQEGQTLSDTFNYSISDGHGGTSSATLTVTIFGTNDAPTAFADTNWTQEDTSTTATGNVLQTIDHTSGAPSGSFGDQADTDVDNGTVLSVSAVNGGAGNVGGSTVGAHGTLVLNANGTYTYTLDNASGAVQALGVGETITDQFTYTASDGHGGTSSSTLTITIFGTNDAPTAVGDTNWAKEDTSLTATGNVLQTIDHTSGAPSGTFGDHADTDPDAHDTLTVTAVSGTASGTVGGSTAGSHGTLHLNADGSYTYNLNNADSAVQGLQEGQTLTDTFNYTASDGHGGTSSATLTVTIFGTNDVPVANADTNWTQEDTSTSATGNVLQTIDHTSGAPSGTFGDQGDTDLDQGTVLSVSAVNGAAGNVGGNTVGGHGTLHLNSDGSYTYTLDNSSSAVQALGVGETLTDQFTYTASDGHGGTSSSTLTITIFGTNDAPVVGSGSASVSEEGLSGGNQDAIGSPDTTNSATASGTISVSDVDTNDHLSVSLTAPVTALTSGGHAITWTPSNNGHTLTGTINSGATPIMTVTINDSGAYTVTLQGPVDHPNTSTEDALSLGFGVVASDGHTTTTGTLTVSVEDDSSLLGAITDSTVLNAAGNTTSGTFSFSAGADGWGHFNVTGPSITGITYTETQLANGTELIAKDSANDTIFTLTVHTNGTYDFQLVTPNAGTTITESLLGLNPGHPAAFEQTTDGLIEFNTTSGNKIDSSNQGFGVNNEFLDGGEQFTMEFHNPGAAGDQPPGTDPFFVNQVVLHQDMFNGSESTRTISFTATNTSTGQSFSGSETIAEGQSLTVNVSDLAGAPADFQFNQLTIVGDGSDTQHGVRFVAADITQTILPQSSDLGFTVTAVDGDGDTTAPQSFTVHVDASTPPVVLDLNGDGLNFVSQSAGVTYDYLGNGSQQHTAWVGKGDGILAYDQNGDGTVTNASEWVFASRVPGATSDLQAVAAEFDTNHDGKLTAADADFGKFGVWQDANGDGVAQPGEFKTLSQLGIVSIDLVSDGKAYTAANGEVQVNGTASFTRADGTTGLVGDVTLGVGSGDPLRAGLQQLSAANSGLVSSLVAAGLIASVDTTAAAAANLSDAPKLPTLDPTLDVQSTKAGAQTSPLETTQHDAAQPGLLSTSNSAAATQPVHSTSSSQEAQPLSATLDTAHDAASPQPTTTESDAHGASGVAAAAVAAAAHSAVGFLDGSAMPIAAAAQALAAAAQNGMAGPELAAQVKAIAQVLHDALGADHAVNQLLASLPAAEQAQGLAPGVAASLSAAPADGAALAAALAHATLSFGELGMVLHLDHGALVINHA